ncbi:NAD(P)-dependent alcohol dehydrogenase [Roseococcus sp. SDR]|uniref:NAD(P)-dependent alcohol dehydrogenase n=1 Tax=Roseococcus sp. SDR TaxID=2835532 RepID=UPI001BD10C9B|nr:NAD(P)-dependent alcohol dehydrogenase [Roseococcus sp. SDR]MBS7792232.1 NAD(P)-dependent alcohol dehydrogenase [Roseococcus sp. SDR]MBV1847546.1 NAD(P)-dependent alcohol dehydrogenase [Roseococcus sp. SDR]
MQAVLWRRYGAPESLTLGEAPIPEPGPGEIRIRVHATTVTSGDARLRGCQGAGIFWLPLRLAYGLTRPRHPIPGMEFAGVVEALGAEVTGFTIGDRVFGLAPRGAHAECLVMAETGCIARQPAGLSHAEAAALPFGGLTALVFLRDVAQIRTGEHILIHGAGGAVGVHLVQLARHFGLTVTAVASARHGLLLRSLGADVVLDRAAEDFTAGAARYDIVLDAVGGTGAQAVSRVLTPRGRHVFVNFGTRDMGLMLASRLRPGPRVLCGYAPGRQADLLTLRDLVEQGAIRPVIGHRMPLTGIIAAHALVDSGRKQGALVIEILSGG